MVRFLFTAISTAGCRDDGVLVRSRSLSQLLIVCGIGEPEDDDDESIEI